MGTLTSKKTDLDILNVRYRNNFCLFIILRWGTAMIKLMRVIFEALFHFSLQQRKKNVAVCVLDSTVIFSCFDSTKFWFSFFL